MSVSSFFFYHYFEWLEPVRDLEDTLIEQNSYSHYIDIPRYLVIYATKRGFLNAFNERTSFF